MRQMTVPIILVLPMPPSANVYWRHAVIKGRAVVYVSAEAKAYKREVAILAKKIGVREPIKGRVRVDIRMYPKRPLDWQKRVAKDPLYWDDTVQRIDLSNARKVLEDALENVVITNDKMIFEDSGKVMEPDGEARVVVKISPIVVASPQPELFGEHHACA